jgi:hypothetical protein
MATDTDIYGRIAPTFGGAFTADAGSLGFAGVGLGGGVGLICQQLSFQYSQNLIRLYEVGSVATYYVAGRAQGGLSLSRVLGPRPVLFAFYTVYGNPCNAGTNVIILTMSQGCSTISGQAAKLLLHGCVLQSVAFSVAAEMMMISEQSQLMFLSLISG